MRFLFSGSVFDNVRFQKKKISVAKKKSPCKRPLRRRGKKTTWLVTLGAPTCSYSLCQNCCSHPHRNTQALARRLAEASIQSSRNHVPVGVEAPNPGSVCALLSVCLPSERAPHGARRWINPPAAINHERWRLLDNVRRVKRAPHLLPPTVPPHPPDPR